MKQFRLLLGVLFFMLFQQTGWSQNFLETGLKESKTYILLAHPTVQNLETMEFLIRNNILEVGDAEFIGIYSSAEQYDYSKSSVWIANPENNRFHLQKFDGELSAANVYKTNPFSFGFKQLFRHSAGVFFFGGPDIQPELYGQKNLYSEVTDPNRHLFELSFLFHLLGGRQDNSFTPFLKDRPGYFVTGFCLGLQSMNVATGGTLTQDIPAQTYQKMTAEENLKLKKDQLHRNYWQEVNDDQQLMGINFHQIQFTAHPFFLKTVRAQKDLNPLVLSSHHQSIDELGKDLVVTATSMDEKVIEGIHHRLYPNVFAVQFHPEVPSLYEEGKKLKFAPDDIPKSFYEIVDSGNREFHLKYWECISKSIRSSVKMQHKK